MLCINITRNEWDMAADAHSIFFLSLSLSLSFFYSLSFMQIPKQNLLPRRFELVAYLKSGKTRLFKRCSNLASFDRNPEYKEDMR